MMLEYFATQSRRYSPLVSPSSRLHGRASVVAVTSHHTHGVAPPPPPPRPAQHKMFGIGRNANATFKPAKRAPAGSRRFELHKHAEATLGAGNLCQAVKCPTGENLNDWWRSVIKGPWLTAARAVTHSSRGPEAHPLAWGLALSELERRDLAALVPAQEPLILLSLTI